jgi:hypothetical protein
MKPRQPGAIGRGLIAGLIATIVLSAAMLFKQSMGVMPELDPIDMITAMSGAGSRAAGWIGLPDDDGHRRANLSAGNPIRPSKDYEFSRSTMRSRGQGLEDARVTLARAPWLEQASPDVAVRTFDVASGKTVTSVDEVGLQRPLPKSAQLKVAADG